ncbi:MAG: hypothetical protein HZY76_08855 [Anaerolineae bacterium]|nr:MAG: hypothetical protein HZY76_08855 [Anaerolineae bacterium]
MKPGWFEMAGPGILRPGVAALLHRHSGHVSFSFRPAVPLSALAELEQPRATRTPSSNPCNRTVAPPAGICTVNVVAPSGVAVELCGRSFTYTSTSGMCNVVSFGYHPVRLSVCQILFDEDAKEGDACPVWVGQHVVGVEVVQRHEDIDQLGVELPLAKPFQPVAEEPQLLHRVDGVHGPFERQVHIEIPDEDRGLFDDDLALRQREFGFAVRELAKLGDRAYLAGPWRPAKVDIVLAIDRFSLVLQPHLPKRAIR